MKTLRHLAVFPFEIALFAAVALLVVANVLCLTLGYLCQWVDGPNASLP